MDNNNQRTKEELDNVEFNYFHYYVIKPSENNPDNISTIIKKKASDTNPKFPRLARDLKDDAIQIMVNDAVFDAASGKYIPNSKGREKERQRLKELVLKDSLNYLQNASKAKKIVLYSLIQKITDSPKNKIQDESIFTFDELLSSARYLEKEQGFQFIDENKSDPFASFDGMEQYFLTLNIHDLYEFLGVDKKASPKDINDALLAKKAEHNKLPTNMRDKKNAYSKLNGKVPVILQNQDQRKLYDYFITFYDDIWSRLKAKKMYNDFDLDFDDFTGYVSMIQKETGLSVKEANQVMMMGVHHYSLNLVGGNEDDGLDTCPKCGKLYSKGLKVCPHCGANLEVLCWNCAKPMSVASKVCPHCGASGSLEANFNKAKANLDAALKEVPIDEVKLESCLLSLRNVYPKYVEHKGCKMETTVVEYASKFEKRKAEKKKIDEIFENYIAKVDDLVARKLFVKASGVLLQAKEKLPSYDFKKYEAQIDSALSKAKMLTSSASQKLKMGNTSSGLDDANKALDTCPDYSEAFMLLKAHPPIAPTDVSVICDKEGAHIHWSARPDATVTYTILRKAGVAIKSDDDGILVAQGVTLNEFIDSSLVSGVPTYYAVYADRKGVHSKVTACLTPALTFLNVSNVHQEIKDGRIAVVFKSPEGAKKVHIRKKKGSIPPSSLSDGEEVLYKDNAFEIKDDTKDVYSFYFITEYEVNGKKQFSSPLKCTYKKTILPKVLEITSSSVKSNGSQFIVTYKPIDKGLSLELYVSDKCYDFEFGLADENVNFPKKFRNLSKADFIPGENRFTYEMKPESMTWVYPVVKNSSLYVICKPLLANSLSGLQALNVIQNEGSIRIEGKLNENTRNLIALISKTDYPKSMTEEGIDKKIISKEDFLSSGGMKLTLMPGVYYITLVCEFRENSETFYSSYLQLPKPINLKKKTPLKCAIEGDIDVYKSKKIKVIFKSSIQGEVPKCELYSGFPRPASKLRGTLLCTIPGGPLKKKLFKSDYYYMTFVDVPPLPRKGDKVAIFFADDENDDFFLQLLETI